LKLVDGKKLVVYFGCFFEDRPQMEDETGNGTFEHDQKTTRTHRTKIIEGIMKSGEAQNVSDLYVKVPFGQLFNPIIFTMHIPLSLQNPVYVVSEKINSLTEDFECVFDGNLILIAGLVEVDKLPFGVFDVRDRVMEMLRKIVKVKSIAPCLHARPISFVTENSQIPKNLALGYVETTKTMDLKILLRKLYDEVGYNLNDFYELCYASDEIDDRVVKIEALLGRLLKSMSESFLTSWKQTLTKRRFTKERRKDMINILDELTQYQLHRSGWKRLYLEFKAIGLQSHVSKLIDDTDLEFYGTPSLTVDIDLTTKAVDYVRSELEGYSRNWYTLLSALGGAILGSIITLLVRTILKI